MSVIFISDSRLCGVEGMRLGSSSSVVNMKQALPGKLAKLITN